jgi:hypothetical protein
MELLEAPFRRALNMIPTGAQDSHGQDSVLVIFGRVIFSLDFKGVINEKNEIGENM